MIVSVVTPVDPHAAALSLATLLDIKAPDAKSNTSKTIAFKNVFEGLTLADDSQSEGVSSESGTSKQPSSSGNHAPDKKTARDTSSGTEEHTVLVAPQATRIPPALLAKNVVLANAAGPVETKDPNQAGSNEPVVDSAPLATPTVNQPVMQPVVQSADAALPVGVKTPAVSSLPQQLPGTHIAVAPATAVPAPARANAAPAQVSKPTDMVAAPAAQTVTRPATPAASTVTAPAARTPVMGSVAVSSDEAPVAKASRNEPRPVKPAAAPRQDSIIKAPIGEKLVTEKLVTEKPVKEEPLRPEARVIRAATGTTFSNRFEPTRFETARPPQGAKIESPKSTAAPLAPESAPTTPRAAEQVKTTDVAKTAARVSMPPVSTPAPISTAAQESTGATVSAAVPVSEPAPASKPVAATPPTSGSMAENPVVNSPAAPVPAPVVTAPPPAGPQPAAGESNVPETQSPTAPPIPAQIPAQISVPEAAAPRVPLVPQAENFAFAVQMMAPQSAAPQVPAHESATHYGAIESKPPVTITQTTPAQSEPVRHEAPAAASPDKTVSETREPASAAKAQQPGEPTQHWAEEPRTEAPRSDAPVTQWTEAGFTTQTAAGTESASQSLPLAAAQAHMATPELPKTTSTSEILLHLTGNDPASADIKAAIRVADRAGSVSVTVHASDPVLRESLRTNLSELSSQLANQGWKTDVVKTAAAAAQSSSQQDSHEGGQRGSQSFGGDRPQRERRGNGGQWQQEFDQQISGGDASSGGKG